MNLHLVGSGHVRGLYHESRMTLAHAPERGNARRYRTFLEVTVIAVPVFQVTLAVIIALFVLQVIRRLSAQSSNPIAQGVSDGIGFLTSP